MSDMSLREERIEAFKTLGFMISGNYKKAPMAGDWLPLGTEDPPHEPEDEYALIETDSARDEASYRV